MFLDEKETLKCCINITFPLILIIVMFIWIARIVVLLAKSQEHTEDSLHLFVSFNYILDMFQYILMIDYVDVFHHFKARMNERQLLCKFLLVLDVLLALTILITYPLSPSDDPDQRYISSGGVDKFEIIGIFFNMLLSYLCLVAYWDYISFQIASTPWVLSFIYFTIIGWIFMELCRWLHPPEQYKALGCWHQRAHSSFVTLHYMIWISIIVTLFLPLGGGLLLAVFAEISNTIAGGESWIVIAAFLVLAHLLMIAPFAPATMIDLAGGYIFMIILTSDGMPFWYSFALTHTILLGSHFTGSCLQWIIGKLSMFQGWLNRALPVTILALSDSTLKESNCCYVGIIGGVFPDTVNGFNQGRIHLGCFTQFFSEWSALPSAFVTITTGAVLSNSGDTDLGTFLPLLGVIFTVVNVMQGTYAVREFAKNIDDKSYILSTEKWLIIQYFAHLGYGPSREGWEEDVFGLADDHSGLFHRIWVLQRAKQLHLADCDHDPLKYNHVLRQYEEKFADARKDYYEEFNAEQLETLAMSGKLVFKKDWVLSDKAPFCWANANEVKWKLYLQFVFFCIIYITMAGASYVFRVNADETVQKGLSILQDNPNLNAGLAALLVNMLFSLAYFFQDIVEWLVSSCKGLFWVLTCCGCGLCGSKSETKVIESEFPTPPWEEPTDEEMKEEVRRVNERVEKAFKAHMAGNPATASMIQLDSGFSKLRSTVQSVRSQMIHRQVEQFYPFTPSSRSNMIEPSFSNTPGRHLENSSVNNSLPL